MKNGAVDIQIAEENLEKYAGDLLVIPVEENTIECAGDYGGWINPLFAQVLATGDFKGKAEQPFLLYPELMGAGELLPLAAKRVLLLGLGKREATVAEQKEQLRLWGGTIAKQVLLLKARDAQVILPDWTQECPPFESLAPEEISASLVEGLLLGGYRFDRYKTPKNEDEQPVRVERFSLRIGALPDQAVREGLRYGQVLAQSTITARDMANMPANEWTPAAFADYARDLSKKTSLKYKSLDQAALQKLGMGGILAVGQGSLHAPHLVILEYKNGKKMPTLLLVGKGLTFDSGGFCLKPPTGMENMKYDMCGGAAVLGVMQAIASLAPTGVNVIGMIPAAENLVGGAAFRPGDVIRHYGGKSSEITNTDAEGRLILADALAYGIAVYKPDAVIDVATLTGAALVALGHHYTALMSNNDDLARQLLAVGEQCGEPLWRLPLSTMYRKGLDSRVADIKNAGDRNGGAITAACYLQEFVGDTPWAHLDIAGTAWDYTKKSYVPKGPSGIGVRTLYALLHNWQPLPSTNMQKK